MTCIAGFLRWKNLHFQIFGSSSCQKHQKSILSNPFILKGTRASSGSALSLLASAGAAIEFGASSLFCVPKVSTHAMNSKRRRRIFFPRFCCSCCLLQKSRLSLQESAPPFDGGRGMEHLVSRSASLPRSQFNASQAPRSCSLRFRLLCLAVLLYLLLRQLRQRQGHDVIRRNLSKLDMVADCQLEAST